MPSTSLLSTSAAALLAKGEDYCDPDYSDLDPEEQAERSKPKPAPAHWPKDQQSQEALATERLGVARQNATLFRARRLTHKGHGLEEPERFFRTGVQAVDDLLAGGLQRNELIEVVGWRSSGRFSLVMSALAGATQAGESAALVDLGDHLDPQAALGAGIDLERLLWLRPQHIKQALGATELLLGAGFSLVVLDLGQPPLRGGRGIEAAWLRLQRGAIDHHSALLVTSPYRASGTAAHAVIELNGARGGWFGQGQQPRILGGLVCEAGLSKSRLARTKQTVKTTQTKTAHLDRLLAETAATEEAATKKRQRIKPRHLFELTFASGLAEPIAALPKLQPRKRRQREAPSGQQTGKHPSERQQPAAEQPAFGAGALRHAG